ncbi:uncharacterized protein LOC105685856 [Athalia rosae]|uniref:uncharacterized protein LOC105685856 n=1 Tax=Athalia rosae TaxID=37344 RepID=UPI0020333A17|nr:uncharacterized protein LOC105685856 [Athalia rosae]
MAGRYNYSDYKRKWRNIKIHGEEYVISTSSLKEGWKIFMTNLVEIWIETITKDIALARCQSLNVLLDLDSFDIEETLDNILNDIPKHATDQSLDEIRLESIIDGVAFKFTINLTKGSPQHFWNEITKPLCQSSMELHRRHHIMLDTIKKKDEELLEYKLSGAELIRKNIETVPWNEDIFKSKLPAKSSLLSSIDHINAFQLMVELNNDSKKCESLIDNDHRPTRETNSVATDLNVKVENIHALDTELRAEVNTNNEAAKNENYLDSVALKAEIDVQDASDQSITNKTISKKRSITNNVVNSSLFQPVPPSLKTKKIKESRNIYDYII